MNHSPSSDSDIDCIGINDSLTQEKSIAKFGSNIFQVCFTCVRKGLQWIENDDIQVHEKRMLWDWIGNLSLKGVVHPLWDFSNYVKWLETSLDLDFKWSTFGRHPDVFRIFSYFNFFIFYVWFEICAFDLFCYNMNMKYFVQSWRFHVLSKDVSYLYFIFLLFHVLSRCRHLCFII